MSPKLKPLFGSDARKRSGRGDGWSLAGGALLLVIFGLVALSHGQWLNGITWIVLLWLLFYSSRSRIKRS